MRFPNHCMVLILSTLYISTFPVACTNVRQMRDSRFRTPDLSGGSQSLWRLIATGAQSVGIHKPVWIPRTNFHGFACFIELWMHPVWHWKSKKKKHLLHNRILTNDKHAFFSWLKITFYNFVRKPLHEFIAREKDTDCSRDKLSTILHLIRTRKLPFNLRLSLRTSSFKMSRVLFKLIIYYICMYTCSAFKDKCAPANGRS